MFAAGADVVQLDEPFLQAYPDKARRFGVPAINRAVEGVNGTTAVHLCFGYGAMVKSKPSGYSFLPELEATTVDQVSIETAQSKLDCVDAGAAAEQADRAGRDRSPGHRPWRAPRPSPSASAARWPTCRPERMIVAPDCGLKYLPRDVAFAKMKAMVEGAAWSAAS